MSYKHLYAYYADRGFAPTFAQLKDAAALANYTQSRVRVFADKLLLPPRVFSGARVLEFGPDTGENALAFAQWGAHLHLAEPNERAHAQIRSYFEQFNLSQHIASISQADVESYADSGLFDLVIAEGFIYTIQPSSRWLSAFSRQLRPEGLAVVSYYERHGAFQEMMLRALLSAYIRVKGGDPVSAARALFQTKWDSIPHTRPFESWVLDVLANPFVRLANFINAEELLDDAEGHGFSLYSSWPIYRQPLTPYWHRRVLDRANELERDKDHLRRSRLSFLLGMKAYVVSDNRAELDSMGRAIDIALKAVDESIDGAEPTKVLVDCADALSIISSILAEESVFMESDNQRSAACALVAALIRLMKLAADGDIVGLVSLCNTDHAFIQSWGMPTHFAVLRRHGGSL